METRELTYFAAVAEELNFGRAAARLGMAQPPLSRAIQKLERRLGVRLFDRSGRGVSLTPAGEVLAGEAARILDAVAAATARTRRAGLIEPRLVVALKPGGDGGLLPDILAAYCGRPDAVEVELALCGVAERARLLRDGTADAAFLHSPYEDLTGFDWEPLRVESRVAVVSAGHALAGRDFVRLADLEADPTPHWPSTLSGASAPAASWASASVTPRVSAPAPSRGSAPATPGMSPPATPRVSASAASGVPGSVAPGISGSVASGVSGSVASGVSNAAAPESWEPATLMQLVALGRLVVVAPESVKDQVRRDLVCVPVIDGEPTTVVLAWDESTRSRALAAFVRTAVEVAERASDGARAPA
ncbi:LysR family transcriptional regulator [Nonomuraea sp. NPDC050404]|uniref:LysR family transcriptional regulator n=1 Tax=Nonomuraea sp. NPDC050404 TaxID=3155783 RepID=UPI003403C57B